MRKTILGLAIVCTAALIPTSVPAQAPGMKERMEELHRRREEARRIAREQAAQAAQGGATAQAGAAQAGAAQAGAAQAGAATQAQAGAAAQAGAGGTAGAKSTAKAGAAGAEAKKEEPKVLDPADISGLRATRIERRQGTVDRLRQRWGPLLSEPRARDELRLHAQRLAHLQRIRALAEQKKQVKLIERVDAVITAEDLRHARTMNSLRDGAPASLPGTP